MFPNVQFKHRRVCKSSPADLTPVRTLTWVDPLMYDQLRSLRKGRPTHRTPMLLDMSMCSFVLRQVTFQHLVADFAVKCPYVLMIAQNVLFQGVRTIESLNYWRKKTFFYFKFKHKASLYLSTQMASIISLIQVGFGVQSHIGRTGECDRAIETPVLSNSSMADHVLSQLAAACKCLRTKITFVGFLAYERLQGLEKAKIREKTFKQPPVWMRMCSRRRSLMGNPLLQ